MATAVGGDVIIRLMTDVASLKGAFETFSERLGAAERRLDQLTETVDQLTKTVDQLGKTVDQLGKTVDQLGKTVGQLGRDVANLQSDLGGLRGPLQVAAGAASRMYSYLEEVAENVGTHAARADATDARLDDVEARLLALERKGKKKG